MFGHSKDHRPDLPQIVIGLAVTREGIPVRVWCWPGNTNDMSVITEVKDDLRGWRLGRVVTVVDRGFSSDENLRYLTRAGGHWIAGERMRDGSPDAQAALARQGRYQTVRDNLRVKEVRVGDGDAAKRFIICHNPAEADRERTQRDDTIHRLAGRARADRHPARQGQERQRPRGAHAQPSARCATTPRSGATCARPRPDGCVIDRAKIKAEASASTASSCSPPPTPTSPPRTSRSATRTCSRPNAASAT